MLDRRALLASAGALALLPACATTPEEESAALDRALNDLSTDILRLSPTWATSLGVSEAQAGGSFLDRLPDVSRAGLAAQVAVVERGRRALGAIAPSTLAPEQAVTHAVVKIALDDMAAGNRFGFGDYGFGPPRPYVVTQLSGAYANLPDFLDSRHPLRAPEHLDAYMARLRGFARVLDDEIARMRDDAAQNVIPPRFVIDGAIAQLEAFARVPASESVLVDTLRRRLPAIAEVSPETRAAAVAEAERVVTSELVPAYGRQIEALKALRARSTDDAGVWKLKDGEAYYAACLRAETTTGKSARDVHALGLDLVARINAEMEAILRAEGLTQGSLAARVQAVSERPDQLYPNTDQGRAQLLGDLNRQIEALAARLPQQFGRLPKATVEVRRVPVYTEAGAPGGYYEAPALDGSRPGAYYINLRDTAEWPRYTLPTLTYHEALPGHHMQIALAQEAEGLPFVRRALLFFTAYVEGWALYAEQLADEMGAYEGDPLGRLGYLQSAAFRAARLVVDTGLHDQRWSRERAIDYMVAATGDHRSAATTEIDRYCVWPGQACSYMVGREEIVRLRDLARTRLGPRYDQKSFHDTLLAAGSTPLSVTEQVIQGWIATQGAA